jgi:hypothetical protein
MQAAAIRPILPPGIAAAIPTVRPSPGGLGFAPSLGVGSSLGVAGRAIGTTLNAYGGMYIIYALLLGVVISIILLVTDAFYPFLPMNPIMGPSAFARAGQTFWATIPPDAENLIVPESSSPTIAASSYSMSIQMILTDSRGSNLGKFRHVLHRGSNPCGISSATAGPSGHAGVQPTDLPVPTTDPNYAATGLPDIMNPGLVLDTYKNDLQIMIHTKLRDSSGNYNLLLESSTIENLPLNTPLTIGIVCNHKTVEIYVNCKLYTTMLLTGAPYLPAHMNQWFGRYCAFPFIGLVKNLQLWPSPLSSSDFIKMCSGGSFSSMDLPATCPSQPPLAKKMMP